MRYLSLSFLFATLPSVLGHMYMADPPPLRLNSNPFSDPRNALTGDQYTLFLNQGGSDYPCKGYLNLLGTPQGRAVSTWAAGSSQTFTLGGSAPHWGGSCQASLSYDNGKTFRVIRSYEGGCPRRTNGESKVFQFRVPQDAPRGEGVIFAWTWYNREHEMYMNCAVVNITSTIPAPQDVSSVLSDRPLVFRANIGNYCFTYTPQEVGQQADVKFPDPGADVVRGDGRLGLAPPIGRGCQAGTKEQGGYGSKDSGAKNATPTDIYKFKTAQESQAREPVTTFSTAWRKKAETGASQSAGVAEIEKQNETITVTRTVVPYSG